ncbi:RNA polymerase beta' subunit [Anopheles sinensis]|uniref:RNA polymerase beta' subunit n=1 Tax=Anopheles sinensis TaxID=74873 RepID=A0A084WBA0_ANOSI|nr:RNA polymerase beta' subunit [Anopheles sinensis]
MYTHLFIIVVTSDVVRYGTSSEFPPTDQDQDQDFNFIPSIPVPNYRTLSTLCRQNSSRGLGVYIWGRVRFAYASGFVSPDTADKCNEIMSNFCGRQDRISRCRGFAVIQGGTRLPHHICLFALPSNRCHGFKSGDTGEYDACAS